jgi:hypothetical protein
MIYEHHSTMHFIIQIRIPVSYEFGGDSENEIRNANIVYHFLGNATLDRSPCLEEELISLAMLTPQQLEAKLNRIPLESDPTEQKEAQKIRARYEQNEPVTYLIPPMLLEIVVLSI